MRYRKRKIPKMENLWSFGGGGQGEEESKPPAPWRLLCFTFLARQESNKKKRKTLTRFLNEHKQSGLRPEPHKRRAFVKAPS